MKKLFLLMLIIVSCNCFSQNCKADSLYSICKNKIYGHIDSIYWINNYPEMEFDKALSFMKEDCKKEIDNFLSDDKSAIALIKEVIEKRESDDIIDEIIKGRKDVCLSILLSYFYEID